MNMHALPQEKQLQKQLAMQLKAPSQILGDVAASTINLESAGTAPLVCEGDRKSGSGTQPGDRPLDALEAVQPGRSGERTCQDTIHGCASVLRPQSHRTVEVKRPQDSVCMM
jgi:hypothetical protein